jgi:hypothetical protein
MANNRLNATPYRASSLRVSRKVMAWRGMARVSLDVRFHKDLLPKEWHLQGLLPVIENHGRLARGLVSVVLSKT